MSTQWKLVPVEPDDAMAQAASSAGSNQHQGIGITAARDMLRAGIAAAPTPVMPVMPEAELFVRTDHLGGYATDDGGCLLWSFGRRSESDAALYTADQVRQFAAAQNAELISWKVAAMTVESEWDAQAVGRAIGAPWGGSIRAHILPWIQKAQARIVELEALNEQLSAQLRYTQGVRDE